MEIVENKINPADVAALKEVQTESAPQYDPKKMYEWGPSSKFTLTGDEFGVILNSLRKVLVSPEAQMILAVDRASDAIENVLARAVATGQVTEKKK